MTQHLVPTSTVSGGAWTFSTTSLHQDTDEGIDAADDETTYAEVDTDGSDMELALSSATDPGTGLGHVLYWRARKHRVHFDVIYLQVALYQGAVLVATGSSTHGNTYTTVSYTLSTAEADAITNYADLRVRVRVTQPIGTAHLHLTAVELTVPSSTITASQRGEFASIDTLGQVTASRTRGELNPCPS